MTLRKKILCQIKRPDRDLNLQSQKLQLLLEPIVDKKIYYMTPKPLAHPVSDNQSERKGLFYIYSERRGDCSEVSSSAIRMTSSSRDIYFHTPSRNQTKL